MDQNPVLVFKKYYKLYIEKIYRFVYIKVNSQELAEDLTSETFLRFWKRLKKENPTSIKNPKAFLYKTARNLVIDHYRSFSLKKEIPLEEIKELKIDQKSFQPIQNPEIERIQSAIKKLKDEYQDVILWYYLDDLSVEEIAKILNKSENATRVMIHRALSQLREIFKNEV